MCTITTVAQYNEQKKWLDEMANLFSDIARWDSRKYHILLALRRFGYSNVKLAGSGNSTLKHETQLWLHEATQDDTLSMVIESEELKEFPSTGCSFRWERTKLNDT